MAVTTESFNADGVNRVFTVATTILSQSHCRVDYYYDDGSGSQTDHEVAPVYWDIINNSVVFREPPPNGYVVKITTSTDGEGLEISPSVTFDVGVNIDSVVTVAENIQQVNTTSDNISTVNIVGLDLEKGFTTISDNGSITEDVTTGTLGASSINTVALNMDAIITSNNTIDSVATTAGSIDSVVATGDAIDSVITTAGSIDSVNDVSLNIGYVKDVASQVFFTPEDTSDDFGDITGFSNECSRYCDLAKTQFTTPIECGVL